MGGQPEPLLPDGVVAPILTPFEADLSVSHDRLVAHAQRVLDEGCVGLAVFGTTGEALSVATRERGAALEALVAGGIDPGGPGGGDFTTLKGVMALFDSPGGATLGWIHYLAFDLFTGMWIARDADQKGFSRIAQFPFLLLTLLVGPVGLFAWLIVRERRARAQAKAK